MENVCFYLLKTDREKSETWAETELQLPRKDSKEVAE